MSSAYTKKCRSKLWTIRAIDFIILFLPLIVYIFIALANGKVTTSGKVAVVGSVAVAAILVLFNILAQKKLRCPIWICMLGLFIAMKDKLLPLIIMLAISTILDDLVFTPLIAHYKTKTTASKVIDEREEAEREEIEEDTEGTD